LFCFVLFCFVAAAAAAADDDDNADDTVKRHATLVKIILSYILFCYWIIVCCFINLLK
jgi:hypothetical protein